VCTVGTRDTAATAWYDRVRDLGAPESRTRQGPVLLERVWDVAARPAVLVVLGHLETEHCPIVICARGATQSTTNATVSSS
jgi:hypothetical protein